MTTDASNLSPPERPHVESMERAAGPVSAAVESGEAVFKPGPNWSKRGVAQGLAGQGERGVTDAGQVHHVGRRFGGELDPVHAGIVDVGHHVRDGAARLAPRSMNCSIYVGRLPMFHGQESPAAVQARIGDCPYFH